MIDPLALRRVWSKTYSTSWKTSTRSAPADILYEKGGQAFAVVGYKVAGFIDGVDFALSSAYSSGQTQSILKRVPVKFIVLLWYSWEVGGATEAKNCRVKTQDLVAVPIELLCVLCEV